MSQQLPDFESMTLDEIIEWKMAWKARMEEDRAVYDMAIPAYNRKVLELHTEEARKQVQLAAHREGISVEELIARWQDEGDQGQRIMVQRIIAASVEG